MEPLTTPEIIVLLALTVLAVIYLCWGPDIEARIKVWRGSRKKDRPSGDDNYYQGRG